MRSIRVCSSDALLIKKKKSIVKFKLKHFLKIQFNLSVSYLNNYRHFVFECNTFLIHILWVYGHEV